MIWSLNYDKLGFSVEAGILKGRDPPDWYLKAPELPEGDPVALWVLEAYADLCSCRSFGGPIPWTAFALYADRKSLSAEAAEALWPVIASIDRAERKWREENKEHASISGVSDDGGDDGE